LNRGKHKKGRRGRRKGEGEGSVMAVRLPEDKSLTQTGQVVSAHMFKVE